MNIRLDPVRTNFIDNDDWSNHAAPWNRPVMKDMIRSAIDGTGRPDFLNIFTVVLNDTTLYWASYPWDYGKHPQENTIVLNRKAIPGKTLIAALATWLGLPPPYEGGCYGPGDGILDTPPQAGPVKGCPTNLKSCPDDHPGDRKLTVAFSLWSPVTHPLSFPVVSNYMSGADDSCKNSFTAGQIFAMRTLAEKHRGIKK